MKIIYPVCLLGLMLAGCFVAPRRGGGVEVIPMLPDVVEVDENYHYGYNGYDYYYVNGGWFYADPRGGPRRELPRDRWPHEVRHRGGGGERGGDRGGDRGGERGGDRGGERH